jgi:hypothetical protein
MALQHLRSSTADKRPTPGAMSDGQLAINTNHVSPGLFFKDSNGDSIKVGPVHVGTTAPNVSPAGQSGNSKGEQWLDTSSSRYVLKIWDGTAWRSEDGEFVNSSGDTMTGALVMDNQQQVRFRETTANGTNFIALQAPASVASDKTITLPDVTGTVITTGDTGSVTSTMILDGTILNADINASAAIVDTKLATISTASKVSNSATTATDANTASAIVARNASGNFNTTSINSGPLAGFRNAILNGDFAVSYRGTSFSSPASASFILDRWQLSFDGTGATRTITREEHTLGQTNVPGNPTNFARWAQTVAGSGGTSQQLVHNIEGVHIFAGTQVTLSFYAKAASNITLPQVIVSQVFGTGGSPSASVNTTAATSVAITTSWQRFSYTITLPSISGKTLGTDGNDKVVTSIYLPINATFTFDISDVQLEPGPVATLYERLPFGFQRDILCARYYQERLVRVPALASPPVSICFSPRMRATPTITGGGAGLVTYASSSRGFNANQTTAADVTFVMVSEV